MRSFFFLNHTPLILFQEYRILTLLQLSELLQITIPRFCYHDKLTIAGNCRMCMVEVTGSIKPIIACASNIGPNMDVYTETSFVKRARENILEFLLINHPLDCPICDQGGECDLQDLSLMYGSDRSRFQEMKRSVDDKEFGPVVKTIMTRCIHCTRCVRFADEVAGVGKIGTFGRGSETEIKMVLENFFDSEISGNVVDLCPVGALTLKPYAFTGRPWELKSIETVDPLDSLNSNIRADVKGNRIFRILPRRNEYLNEEWITDLVRFSYESFQAFRVRFPYVHLIKENFLRIYGSIENGGFFGRLSWSQVLMSLDQLFHRYNFNSLFFFLGNENGLFVSYFFHYLYLHTKSSYFFVENDVLVSDGDEREEFYSTSSWNDFLKSNLFLFYDLNLKEQFPVLNARINRHLTGNLLKKYCLYVGSNRKSTFFSYHLGFSSHSLFRFLHGSLLTNNFIFKLSSRFLFFLSPGSLGKEGQFLNQTSLFHSCRSGSFLPYSNLPGFYEFGIQSSLVTETSLYCRPEGSFYYFLKTSMLPAMSYSSEDLIFFQGSYFSSLPSQGNFFFLPATNVFEQEDSYVNLFGGLQFTSQAVDFSETEEVRSDFYILKKFVKYLFFFNNQSYSGITDGSFELLMNEFVFFFLSYFCYLFDQFPFVESFGHSNLSYFYPIKGWKYSCLRKYNPFSSFYVQYSSTLNRSMWLRYRSMTNFSFSFERISG